MPGVPPERQQPHAGPRDVAMMLNANTLNSKNAVFHLGPVAHEQGFGQNALNSGLWENKASGARLGVALPAAPGTQKLWDWAESIHSIDPGTAEIPFLPSDRAGQVG